jgi:hypothetical protein
MKSIFATFIIFSSAFVNFANETNEVAELTPLPTRIYQIGGQNFVVNLDQLINRKTRESNEERLTRFFEEQHIEIFKPSFLWFSADGTCLVIHTTAENHAKIKSLLSNKFRNVTVMPNQK